MEQELETIDCIITEGSVKDFSESSEACTASDATFTAKQIAEELKVSVRSVYGYANRLLEAWHWLLESEFRKDGIYTAKALEEMAKLKSAKSFADYVQQVARENNKPVTQPSKTTSAMVPVRMTEILEAKIVGVQGLANARSLSIQDRVTTIRERLATEDTRTKKNLASLEEVEAETAIARGVEKALRLFELEEQAANATREQLLLEKLQRDS